MGLVSGLATMIRRIVAIGPGPGISMSRMITSGWCSSASAMASSPVAQSATTRRLGNGLEQVDLTDQLSTDRALTQYSVRRIGEVRTMSEFSHRFAKLFTQTGSRAGYARTRYVLGRHGHSQRLCHKIMHNISGLGYETFSILDRLQQIGLADRRSRQLPSASLPRAAADVHHG